MGEQGPRRPPAPDRVIERRRKVEAMDVQAILAPANGQERWSVEIVYRGGERSFVHYFSDEIDAAVCAGRLMVALGTDRTREA